MKALKIIFAGLLSMGILFALPPGEGEDTNIYNGYFYNYADKLDGSPAVGKSIPNHMSVNFYYGGPQEDNATAYTTTNSSGYAYRKLTISVPPAWGSPTGKFLSTSAPSAAPNYSYPEEHITNSSFVFSTNTVVDVDVDGNNFWDEFELEFAERFVPTYIPHSSDEWLHPEPVDFIPISRGDIMVDVYSRLVFGIPDYHGKYPMADESLFTPPLSEMTGKSWMAAGSKYSSAVQAYIYGGWTPTGFKSLSYDGGGNVDSYIELHWDYAGNCDSDDCWDDYYTDERASNNYSNTVYAHMFTVGATRVIQYWVFFPYNNFINKHEGDWEHINVIITYDPNPNNTSIYRAEYFFHHKYISVNKSDLEFADASQRHPKVYVGGEGTISAISGVQSGAQFPQTGQWTDVETPVWEPWGVDEIVMGFGPEASYASFIDGDGSDGRGIVILPDIQDIDYNLNPEMSWVSAKIPWGDIRASGQPSSMFNPPPYGPSFRSGWNAIGGNAGDGPEDYDIYDPSWILPGFSPQRDLIDLQGEN